MKCPHCKIELLQSNNKDTQIQFHYCPSCKGKAVSKEQFGGEVNQASMTKLFKLAPYKMNTILCPSCSNTMVETVFDPEQTYLKLDLCQRCEWLWFDFSEFSLLKKSKLIDVEAFYKGKMKALHAEFQLDSNQRVYKMKKQTEFANKLSHFMSKVLFGRRFY